MIGQVETRVSIIVPAYNASSTIERCLAALVAQQSAPSFEIIVIDDGSQDATPEIVAQFPQVRLIRSSHRGAAAARNYGAREAHGEILLFTDADCEPAPSWVREMLSPFDDHSVFGVKGVYRTRQRERIARFVQLEYAEKYARMAKEREIDFIDTYSAGYRRDIFLNNGGFDETFPTASVEDQEFSFRLAKQGHRLVFAPNAVVYHQHVTTLRAYAARKFRIGFYKVYVHLQHPDKLWHDSHTPATLKLQVALLFGMIASFLAAMFCPTSLLLTIACLFVFITSAMPLISFITQHDTQVVSIAPMMIGVRAASLGLGLMAGVWHEFWRSARLKRWGDVVGALLGLVLCAPIFLIIALAIKLDTPGPILFSQKRAGKDGVPFTMYKFRSMIDDAEARLGTVIEQNVLPPPIFKIPNDPRITRVGRVLRRFSIDELPQLWNVVRGEMSLVGPRPEEMPIVAQYDVWQRRRLAMRPGMTGPMQVNGRANLSLDERVRLELAYMQNYSLWEDLKLIIKTLPVVICGEGSY